MQTQLDDASLWALSRGGDGDAFVSLFRRHATVVYNYCFRRSGSWVVAVDLLCVVFRETWRRRDQVDLQQGSLLPYLLGTANTVAPTRRRLRGRRPEGPGVAAASARLDVDDETLMRAALDAIRRLPRVEQDAIALCSWQGLSESEAALAMNVPTGVVSTALQHARDRADDEAPGPAQLPATREPSDADVEAASVRLGAMVAARHRSRLLIAMVAGTGAIAATITGVWVVDRSVEDTSIVRCFTAATLDGDAVFLSRMDDAGFGLVQLADPVAACADLWAQGVLVAGDPDAHTPTAGGALPVPTLTACTIDDTRPGPIVAVVPGPVEVCDRLQLRPWRP